MTRDEAIAEIQWHLGNRGDLSDKIVLALARAQRQLETGRTLPWFLKQEDATANLPLGSSEILFPSGFLREIDDEAFHYQGATGLFYLEKMDLRTGTRRFNADNAGKPRAYAIREVSWKFWPARDATYNLTYSFYKTAGTLASNVTDNAWLVNAPETLIGKAGGIIASVIAHDRAKALFDEMFLTAFAEVLAENEIRQRENLPLYMGGRL